MRKTKQWTAWMLMAGLAAYLPAASAFAAKEHGGAAVKEHGGTAVGKEHGGKDAEAWEAKKAERVSTLREAAAELQATRPDLAEALNAMADRKEEHHEGSHRHEGSHMD